MKFICPIVWLVACLAAVGCNRREEWPFRPVTLVCPWSAGGGTDRVSRQFAVQLERELGVPVNVVNATGGGGVTGHTRGATATADGYTLTMATVELNMLHWRSLCPITPGSFEPLAMINQDSAAIFVSADSPWHSLRDLEAKLRQSTESLRASGTAAGGIWHLALLGWLDRIDLPSGSVTWVSINGAAPSLQEMMAGGLEIVCCSIPEARGLIDAGEVRCLGVMSKERSPAAPEVATFAEQGIDWSIGAWRGLLFPKGVPEDRVTKMRQAVLNVANSNEFRQFMAASGFQVAVADGVQFDAFLTQTDADFGEILNQPQMKQTHSSTIGPYFLPSILAALGIVVGAFGWGISRSTLNEETKSVAAGNLAIDSHTLLRFAAAIGLFIVLCETLGYVISAGVMLLAMLLMLRVGLRLAVTVTMVTIPSLYHVFAVVLGVPLPWGWLGW
ncbi:tripartite tricarboxylate transporter substrate-binding protein [Stieleria sp. ICT_E10.1]|uniref:tripartite tricarboxylate transporter substrate-binding protein n=1 Tax=Stieleria sedimenti TaxID=2976331 RepID=UPI0021801B5B|nr:tripartite tricarboxylate transporter substrate-binding protein [Stieleria sedimenti]MCS7465952.1 tripartite tricarboxylate transporter substrate-binding protein [Stieleria sedimenti]